MKNDNTDHASPRVDELSKAITAASSATDVAHLYVERGHCYELLGDTSNSVKDFLRALDTAAKKSDIVHIRSMIALALAKKDQKEQALFWATSAVDQDAGNAEGLHTLGLVCDICGFTNIAVDSLRRAISLEPDRWDSLRLLGSCLRENGQLHESVKALARYVAHNPDEPLGLYNLAWSLHIVAGGNVEMLHRAKDMYERTLSSNLSSEMKSIVERKLADVNSTLK